MPLSIFKRLFICFCFALLTALPAQAEEQKNGTLPPALETALSTLLADAPQGKADPDAATPPTGDTRAGPDVPGPSPDPHLFPSDLP